MFDHPSRHADDASDTDLDIKGQNSKNEKTNTEMLDSFIDEMLKEAKKNKVNKKKNLVQRIFWFPKRPIFLPEEARPKAWIYVWKILFTEQLRIDQEERQRDREIFMNFGRVLNGNNNNK